MNMTSTIDTQLYDLNSNYPKTNPSSQFIGIITIYLSIIAEGLMMMMMIMR